MHGERPHRQALLGYAVGAWAVLEIVVTVSELAGLPLAVPRTFAVVLVAGLIGLAVVTLVRQAVRVMQSRSDSAKWETRSSWLGALTLFFGLLPGSFMVRNGSMEWIMWRDAPILALPCGAVAIGAAVAWRSAARIASS